jgi:hypothetical protein
LNLIDRPRISWMQAQHAGWTSRLGGFPWKGRTHMNAGSYSALDSSVLVLNKTFVAVHIISVRRAFC